MACVFPAHAGIDLDGAVQRALYWGFPRARGDRPRAWRRQIGRHRFSPRTRGSTRPGCRHAAAARVFPAHAGIDLASTRSTPRRRRFPRARGDRPFIRSSIVRSDLFSPRTRGSTRPGCRHAAAARVFPAHAGIDRSRSARLPTRSCFPRARGDRPWVCRSWRRSMTFSPRTRGSTPAGRPESIPRPVFPAHAGIDPSEPRPSPRAPSFPRARGDRPVLVEFELAAALFSPRTRGSTRGQGGEHDAGRVFPAHAGIDPSLTARELEEARFPRARGDRPLTYSPGARGGPFSPRTRGSTLCPSARRRRVRVFPAHAGIDLEGRACLIDGSGFPRARGDRPGAMTRYATRPGFSPRTRGSTQVARCLGSPPEVFPAHAWIDPSIHALFAALRSFPRARGDRPHRCAHALHHGTFSPRTRGSTFLPRLPPRAWHVFPAHAGIDPLLITLLLSLWGFPRARGDRPGHTPPA